MTTTHEGSGNSVGRGHGTEEGVPLAERLRSLAEGAEAFKAEHGSCEVMVTPTSPIAKARIEQVAGFRIDVDSVSFVSVKTGERTKLGDSEVYFHTDDHPAFGSKVEADEDGWDW